MMVLQSARWVLVAAAGVALGLWYFTRPDDPPQQSVAVSVPGLSAEAQASETAFNANCSDCHGQSAAGTVNGPPLIHRVYEPSHHGDGAFFAAARNGVRAHHWNFGDMPPVDGVSDGDITRIVTYVRELQRHNGIQ